MDSKNIMSESHVFKSGELKTTMSLLREVNNDMCHNYYWLVRVRLVSEGRVWRSRFVVWFDVQDACEYFDLDVLSKKKIREYAAVVAGSFLDSLKTENFTRADWRRFHAMCVQSIEGYNK